MGADVPYVYVLYYFSFSFYYLLACINCIRVVFFFIGYIPMSIKNSKAITFWALPETLELLDIGTKITGFSRSKIIQLLIDSQLEDFILKRESNSLSLEAKTIKLRSKLSSLANMSNTNTRFGIKLK